MKVIRQVDIFDNQTEKLVQEISIDFFDLEIFKKRFQIGDDILMYNLYEITSFTADLFPEINFDFDKYSYYIACYQSDL